jgi:hypothetical protein
VLSWAIGLVEQLHDLHVGPVQLARRNAHSDFIIAGQTATKYKPKAPAAGEIDALYSLILSIAQSLEMEAKRGKAKLAAAPELGQG